MAPRDLLADLTDAQREAVTHVEGPLLILAAAGSGKTRVITRRVAHLLQQGVRPGNILAITFTNKAAGEMRQRVEDLVPGNRVWVSTFHSLGARLLRQYADHFHLDRNFTIYDMSDRSKLLKMALEDAGLDNNRFSPDSIGAAISKAKNQLLSPERYAERANDFYGQTVARVYPIYEKRLRDANALDFDDLLYWPALGLRHDAELRAELDARFRFVLIDEYQDTNHAQYAIARGLSIDNPNLCVVGDPDQSIYKFRGSDIRNILDFERDFPDARVLTLSLNYRSTKAILPRRRLGHRPQQAAQAQGPPHRKPRRPSGHDPDLRERPGRGRGHRQAHPRRPWSPASAPTATSPCSCASTPCRAAWKRRSSSSGCRFRSSKGWRSSTARRTRTCWPTCGCCSTRATICRSCGR